MTHAPLFIAVLMVLGPVSPAGQWVDTKHGVLIDVDSIKKAKDGLVYYDQKRRSYDMDDSGNPAGVSWGKASKVVVDCEARVSFPMYDLKSEPDWRAKGVKVKPGTMGEALLDFVCTRVQ